MKTQYHIKGSCPSAAKRTVAQLHIKSGDSETAIDLLGERITIGRSPENIVVLDDLSVSSLHAELIRNDGTWLIHDLSSSNGTTINGSKIDESEVFDGDVIVFAGVECRFEAASPSSVELPAAFESSSIREGEPSDKRESPRSKAYSRFAAFCSVTMQEIIAVTKSAALRAKIEKLKMIDLNQAFYVLGKQCYESGKHRDLFSDIFIEIDCEKTKIQEKEEAISAGGKETVSEGLKRTGAEALRIADQERLKLSLKQKLTYLGKLIAENNAEPEVEPIRSIQNRIAGIERARAEIARMSKATLLKVCVASALLAVGLFLLRHFAASPLDGEANPDLVFTDPASACRITITHVLLGKRIFEKLGIGMYNLDDIRNGGDNIVYLELLIENHTASTQNIWSQYFQIKATDGANYQEYIRLGDSLVTVLPSQISHMSVSFTYPKALSPVALVFDTHLERAGNHLIASADLTSIGLFKHLGVTRVASSEKTTSPTSQSASSDRDSALVEPSLKELARKAGVSDDQLEGMIKEFEGRSKYRDTGEFGEYSRSDAEAIVRGLLTGLTKQ
jgi:hypothetical protein